MFEHSPEKTFTFLKQSLPTGSLPTVLQPAGMDETIDGGICMSKFANSVRMSTRILLTLNLMYPNENSRIRILKKQLHKLSHFVTPFQMKFCFYISDFYESKSTLNNIKPL